ncbi:MAG TPA: hypothetical protein VFF73_40345, partial [Planctomycetota bacterium]|nr:hypothetical protein [Planctomycetota bacterium]
QEMEAPRDVLFDTTSVLVVWTYNGPFSTRVIASAQTGQIHSRTLAGVIPGRGCVFVIGVDESGRVRTQTCTPDTLSEWTPVPNWPLGCRIKQFNSEGTLLLLSDNGVYDWPSMRLVRSLGSGASSGVVVDWKNQCFLDNDTARGTCTVTPFGTEDAWTIGAIPSELVSLGSGFLCCPRAVVGNDPVGLVLFSLAQRRRIDVIEQGTVVRHSLSDDGRGLRALLAEGAARRGVRLELDRGKGIWRGAATTFLRPGWHPIADVWTSSSDDRYEQRTLDGTVLLTLPCKPARWSCDGHALVANAKGGRLQLWRAPA